MHFGHHGQCQANIRPLINPMHGATLGSVSLCTVNPIYTLTRGVWSGPAKPIQTGTIGRGITWAYTSLLWSGVLPRVIPPHGLRQRIPRVMRLDCCSIGLA